MVTTSEVVEALYALEEPWRSRFLHLVANKATGWRWDGRGEPTREELEEWLTDLRLRRWTAALLRAWTGSTIAGGGGKHEAETERRGERRDGPVLRGNVTRKRYVYEDDRGRISCLMR